MILASLAGIAVFGYNALFVGWSPFPRYGQCGDEQPISVPFAVEKAGTRLTCEVVIEDAGSYGVYLSYFHNRTREDVDRIEYLTGGQAKGRPITVHYIVKSLAHDPIMVDSIETTPRIMFLNTGVFHAPLAALELSPGRYEVTVESLEDVPEMATVRTELMVRPYSIAK